MGHIRHSHTYIDHCRLQHDLRLNDAGTGEKNRHTNTAEHGRIGQQDQENFSVGRSSAGRSRITDRNATCFHHLPAAAEIQVHQDTAGCFSDRPFPRKDDDKRFFAGGCERIRDSAGGELVAGSEGFKAGVSTEIKINNPPASPVIVPGLFSADRHWAPRRATHDPLP